MRFTRIRMIALVLLAAAAAVTWAAGFPEPRVEYSADSVMETEDATMTSRVFQAPGKKRIEPRAGGGAQPVMILRRDRGVMWLLMARERMYMEQGLDQSGDIDTMEVETTTVGRETIEGRATTKYKMIARRPDGVKLGGFTWLTDDGIPLKTDLISIEGDKKVRMKMELKNVATGPQDPGLFEVPPGYHKFDMGSLGVPRQRERQRRAR